MNGLSFKIRRIDLDPSPFRGVSLPSPLPEASPFRRCSSSSMNSTCPCGGAHSSDASPFDASLGSSLFSSIDLVGVRALNEAVVGSARLVCKGYNERTTGDPSCSSCDDDCELIVHVPFVDPVRVKFVSITGGPNSEAPNQAKLWVDRDDIDFDNCHDVPPSQTLDLVDPDEHAVEGTLDYPVTARKFQNVSSITLFFSDNFGGDRTTITYLGFKGNSTEARRGVVDCVYETRGMPADHKQRAEEGGLSRPGV